MQLTSDEYKSKGLRRTSNYLIIRIDLTIQSQRKELGKKIFFREPHKLSRIFYTLKKLKFLHECFLKVTRLIKGKTSRYR